MKDFYVRLPIAGVIEASVTAENEEEAIEKAIESASLKDIGEWEVFKTLVQGNVVYAPLWEVEVEEE